MWPTLIPLLGNLVDKLFPDPAKAAEGKLELMRLAQNGELAQLTADTDLAKGQMDINKVEAGSNSLFVSGWRPFVGWMCGVAFGFKYIGGPTLFMLCQAIGVKVELPQIDTAEMMPLLFGLLGLGAYRTYEKARGVAAPGK
jgi:hypothetical protein